MLALMANLFFQEMCRVYKESVTNVWKRWLCLLITSSNYQMFHFKFIIGVHHIGGRMYLLQLWDLIQITLIT